MRITDLLDARSISLQAAPGNKEEALNQAVELMTQRGNISDKAAYRRQVGEREKERHSCSARTTVCVCGSNRTRWRGTAYPG